MKKYGVLFLMCGAMVPLHGKMVTAKSMNKFDRIIGKRPLVVVMIYKEDKETKADKTLQGNINQAQRMFENVSQDSRYRTVDMVCVQVNVARDDLQEAVERYGVKKLPTFLLFSNGRKISDQKNGFISGDELRNLIENNFADTINAAVNERAERKSRRPRSSSYVTFGYGGYPYGYYGPGYYGPAYYTPYYGGYYGPGGYAGFGFSF